MAIVNSILGYKLSGKLGNIIFQFYNKKTIARSLNPSISKPSSPAQILNQNKFKNCKAAFLFSDSFFMNLLHYDSQFYQVESLFFKMFFKYFNSNPFISNFNSWLSLRNKNIEGNPFITITSIEPITDGPYENGTLIRFNTLLPYRDVMPIISILVVDGHELNVYVSHYDLPEEDYNLGIYKHVPMSNINTMPAAYISSRKLKSVSNIMIT